MRFDWLKCRSAQLQFDIYWAPGQENLGDFFTKNHLVAHHMTSRPIYLATDLNDKLLGMQGGIKIFQLYLAKLVTHQIHTKFSPVPVVSVTSKPVSYKQLIQTVK